MLMRLIRIEPNWLAGEDVAHDRRPIDIGWCRIVVGAGLQGLEKRGLSSQETLKVNEAPSADGVQYHRPVVAGDRADEGGQGVLVQIARNGVGPFLCIIGGNEVAQASAERWLGDFDAQAALLQRRDQQKSEYASRFTIAIAGDLQPIAYGIIVVALQTCILGNALKEAHEHRPGSRKEFANEMRRR